MRSSVIVALTVLAFTPACSGPSPKKASSSATAVASPMDVTPPADPDLPPPAPSPYDALPEETRAVLDTPFTGDLDEMIKRRVIRAGVVFNRTQYFIDRGVQSGIVYDGISLFEKELNKRLKTGKLMVHVAFVPLSRDQLFPALRAGKVDLVAAALTITPERKKVAAFSTPTRTNVSEVVVTAPQAPAVRSLDDLSGRDVFVRKSSSYYESLQALNAALKSRGKPPVNIVEAPDALEDDDILEMVSAGLVDVTVVDDFVTEFWRQVFPKIEVHRDVAVRTGGEIGVGIRPDNPKLLQAVNAWIKKYGRKTAFGNVVERRYLTNAAYVKSAEAEAERAKFRSLVKYFRTHGDQYGVDAILMAAQGYQESGLNQSAKSQVGAIGVMQVMPQTGKQLAVGDISQVEPNIHAGVKYFRFMVDQYYKDDPMDPLNKGLMTLASYNAGPNRIRSLRQETARRGLDPNKWFGNVERVVSERIGRETVQYVGNIYKYYVAYKLALDRQAARDKARSSVTSGR